MHAIGKHSLLALALGSLFLTSCHPPKLDSITPTGGSQGGAYQLDLQGANFTQGSRLLVDGVLDSTTPDRDLRMHNLPSFVSDSELKVDFTIATPATTLFLSRLRESGCLTWT